MCIRDRCRLYFSRSKKLILWSRWNRWVLYERKSVLVLNVYNVWCVAYSIAVSVCSIVVTPIITFFSVIPCMRRFVFRIFLAEATVNLEGIMVKTIMTNYYVGWYEFFFSVKSKE